MSEPAILVKRTGKASQVWSMDKLENKLIDMRDLYGDGKEHVSVMYKQCFFPLPVMYIHQLFSKYFINRTRMILLIHFMNTMKIIT